MFSRIQYRAIISTPEGGEPARTSRAVTASSRRENAAYTVGRYMINSARSTSPIAASVRVSAMLATPSCVAKPRVRSEEPDSTIASYSEPPFSPQNIKAKPQNTRTSHVASRASMPSGP